MKDAQFARGGWQPIETAPKDGTSILITRPGGNVWKARFWNNAWGVVALGAIKWEPTHWMPLPDPPEASRRV